MDALAWCFLESLARPLDNPRARGGTVHVVEGGYSYATPELETRASGLLAYPMGPQGGAPSSAASVPPPPRRRRRA